MANPNIPFNLVTTDPSETEVFMAWMRETMLSINCHVVATVKTFNASNQTLIAEVNYPQTYYNGNKNLQQVPYPVLMDMPVICLQGGGGKLTFPIAPGDQCLVLFNDRDLNNWFEQVANTSPLATPRLHSLADGIAIVGLNRGTISGYDQDRARLEYNQAVVAVGKSHKVLIKNSSKNLNTLLQSLITKIDSLATACAAITVTASGSATSTPLNSATFTALVTDFNGIATDIAGLLE